MNENENDKSPPTQLTQISFVDRIKEKVKFERIKEAVKIEKKNDFFLGLTLGLIFNIFSTCLNRKCIKNPQAEKGRRIGLYISTIVIITFTVTAITYTHYVKDKE